MSPSLVLLVLLALLLVAVLALQWRLLQRRPDAALDALRTGLDQALRAEQREGRGELRQHLDSLSAQQEQRLAAFGQHFGQQLAALTERTDQRLDLLGKTLSEDARKARSEGAEQQQRFAETLGQQVAELTRRNEQRIAEMRATLEAQL